MYLLLQLNTKFLENEAFAFILNDLCVVSAEDSLDPRLFWNSYAILAENEEITDTRPFKIATRVDFRWM